EVARLYQDLGFADPVASGHLESVPGRDGDPVIRLYFQTPKESPGLAPIMGAYVSRNPDKDIWRSSLNVNIAKAIINGRVPDIGYQTLAHELFHAVLAASAFKANGRAYGRWMSEGMPDALGYYAARKLRRLRFAQEHTDIQFIKVYGGRSYALPLEDPDEELGDHYFTSSFWRYLAELTHASKNGKPHPGPGAAQEDYSYLADFLATPHSGPDNPTGQIAWLNRNTRSHPHIRMDLATVHAKFVAVFADIINTRISLGCEPEGGDPETSWLKKLFFDCHVAGSIRPHVQTPHTLPIRENA